MAKKKRYSVEERANYHKKRKSSPSVSDNQRAYSTHWLMGYNDPYVANNLRALDSEIERDRKYFSRSDYAVYYGYRNGLKANLSKKNK